MKIPALVINSGGILSSPKKSLAASHYSSISMPTLKIPHKRARRTIKKTLIYSILTALLSGIFVGLIFLGDLLVGHMTGFESLWMVFIGAIAISLIIQPFKERIQQMIDRLFFRTSYDYQRILRNYSQALAHPTNDLNRYAKLAPYLVGKSLNLSGASVLILNREKNLYEVRNAYKNNEPNIGCQIPAAHPLAVRLLESKKALIKDEVADPVLLAAMSEHQMEACIPCISESQYFKKPTLICILALGEKLSGSDFTAEDISFLEILANQTSITVEYAYIMEELKRNQAILVQQEKLATLGTTAASIAHELKNPLSYLTTLAQLLPLNWGDKNFQETTQKFLPSEVSRMKIIIDGILDYSRNKELIIEEIDLTKTLEKIIMIVAHDIRKQNISLVKNFPAERKIKGDPNRLAQVFMNLINNACEAMDVSAKKELTISLTTDGAWVMTRIQDTGCGIPQDKFETIFDPFYSTKKSGTGLGLPITKKIIEEHHGQLQITSEPGQGTIFTIKLPSA